MLTCQSERFGAVRDDIKALAPAHWKETADYQEHRTYDPDWDLFERMEAMGRLYCVTLREGDMLVGYNIGFFATESHSKDRWIALADAYYIDPTHRARGALLLFRHSEHVVREHFPHPAKALYYRSKMTNRAGEFFAAMGYDQTAVVWSKEL